MSYTLPPHSARSPSGLVYYTADQMHQAFAAGAASRDGEVEALRADAAFAIDSLAMMFDKYENGVTCYEDPEECSGALGNAISIDNEDFHAIADFLNKHRPVAAIAAEGKTS